jgi:spore coat protein U-like protein
MSRKTTPILAATALAVLLLADAPAFAGSAFKDFNATASVAANCVMGNINNLDFGSYDPVVANASAALPGSTSFTLTCTRGTSTAVVSMNLGNALGGNAANPNKRSMNNGTATAGNYLSYDLFIPSGVGGSATATANLWGDNTNGTVTFPVPAVPTLSAQTIVIYGAVAAGQDVPVGSYTDTVRATVNF